MTPSPLSSPTSKWRKSTNAAELDKRELKKLSGNCELTIALIVSICVITNGCGRKENVSDIVAANEYPLLVATSVEVSNDTLQIYGARRVDRQDAANPIDVKNLYGWTLLYCKSGPDAIETWPRSWLPSITADGQVADRLYNIAPELLMQSDRDEFLIVDVSMDGAVVCSHPSGIQIVRFRPTNSERSSQK